jgi:hypothetical protein
LNKSEKNKATVSFLRILFLSVFATILSCKPTIKTENPKGDSLEVENLKTNKKETRNSNRQSAEEVSKLDMVKKETPQINEVLKRILENKDSIVILVKITGQKDLVKVINRNWPENIETTYNVFKNQQGQIIYIAEFPTSESGDWDLRLEYFFSEVGQLTAFVKDFSFFNSPCLGEGIANEQLLELYDSDFNVIETIKTLTDDKGKPLDEKKCRNTNYDIEYDIRPTANEFMELKGIRI